MMSFRQSFLPSLPRNVLLLAVLLPSFAFAAALKPLPNPDLSKLDPAVAKETRGFQEYFAKNKTAMTGDDLAELYATLGAAYVRAGLFDAAEAAIYNAAQLGPHDARWPYVQGVVARMQDKHAEAERYFERTIAENASYLPSSIALAGERMRRNDLDGARAPLEAYIAKYQNEPAPYALLGDIALREKRYGDAIRQLQRALQLDPAANALYASLATAHDGAGNAEAARAARAKAGNVPPRLDDPLLRRLLSFTPATAKVVRGKERPRAGAPGAPGAGADLGELLAKGRYDEVRRLLDAALAKTPGDASLLALYARTDAAAGDLEKARTRARAAVAADPRNAQAQLDSGLVAEMSNDDAGAQGAYQRAISADPELAEARYRYGNLLMRTGRHADAVEQYRALTRISPDNGEAWARLLAAHVGAGHCAAGIKEMSDGLGKQPKDALLLQLFARVASTCPGARPEERRIALDYAGDIYKANIGDAAQVGEAYALALAANGKWDEAVETQAAAMFAALRNGGDAASRIYREFYDQFKAHKLPNRPWPRDSAAYSPPRPAPDARPAKTAQPTGK
jgi:tetratricopeptide (TPR) repeat protein